MDPKIFVDKNTNSILNDMEIKLSEAFLSYNLRSMCETTNSEWGITLTLPIEIPLIVDSSSANCCSFSLISEGMTLDHGLTTDCWHNDKILKKKKKSVGQAQQGAHLCRRAVLGWTLPSEARPAKFHRPGYNFRRHGPIDISTLHSTIVWGTISEVVIMRSIETKEWLKVWAKVQSNLFLF